jgi:hypothetical protein
VLRKDEEGERSVLAKSHDPWKGKEPAPRGEDDADSGHMAIPMPSAWRRTARRRTRPMVCLVSAAGADRIICSIFHRFHLEWRNRTLRLFAQAA